MNVCNAYVLVRRRSYSDELPSIVRSRELPVRCASYNGKKKVMCVSILKRRYRDLRKTIAGFHGQNKTLLRVHAYKYMIYTAV